MTYEFDRDYKNTEQVREFMPAFLAAFAEIDPSLSFAYNDQFLGKIPAIEGNSEKTAIYLLQTLKRLDELAARIAAMPALRECEHLDEITKFSLIVHYGFYSGGTGYEEFMNARLVPSQASGYPYMVLTKGKRTHGHLLTGGKVLVMK